MSDISANLILLTYTHAYILSPNTEKKWIGIHQEHKLIDNDTGKRSNHHRHKCQARLLPKVWKEGGLPLSNEQPSQSISLSPYWCSNQKKKQSNMCQTPTPCSPLIKETTDVAPHHAMGWALAMQMMT